MIIKEVTDILEDLAPLHYAEDFDNVGLLVGNTNTVVSGILVTLDTIESVLEEAISKNCNLVITFHPIIFKGLKKLTGSNYVERTVIKAIKNDIAIYSMHTALDNSSKGVNAKICEVLEILNPKILIPQKGTIKKLTTYVPLNESNHILNALFEAGAGHIGNYSNCSFITDGTGSYMAGKNANPTKGNIGKIHHEQETQINVIFPKHKEIEVLNALLNTHSYEEVAYEIFSLENVNQNIGMGMIGELEKPMDAKKFLEFVKEKMKANGIRHSELCNRKIKKIAVLGGSGSFAISAAKAAGADLFITADIKYHQFFEAENRMMVADIGHFETEQFTKNLLVDYLTKKIPNFAIRLSGSKTNPIKYL